MHKNTLADIVIRSLRLANSVIDSSYEFPEVNLNVSEELQFRESMGLYFFACHDRAKKEEASKYAKSALEYAASLYDNNYGEVIAKDIRRVKRIQAIGYMFFFWNRRFIGQIKETLRMLENAYLEYEARNDTAKEIREATQKEFGGAIYERWDELTMVWEDIREDEIKRFRRTHPSLFQKAPSAA